MTKQNITVPVQQPGESDENYIKRVERWIRGEDVRSKVDNREWTGSPPFHLSKEED